jgi:hypothetical protein
MCFWERKWEVKKDFTVTKNKEEHEQAIKKEKVISSHEISQICQSVKKSFQIFEQISKTL